MCRYRKSLFLCNHSQLSQEPFIICAAQRDYLSGTAAEPCDTVKTHSCSTIRVPRLCEHCENKKITTEQRFTDVKTKMAELRQHLDRMYGDCMKHVEGAGLEPEAKPSDGDGGGKEEEDRKEEFDPVEEFLRKKMNEKHSHLMMLGNV
ncbi:hypothetical protein HD806DRAFT_546400 [Xylariaceae sp. AK1471]|nr:hypothetical protein HD806DRAFT_546400 [Xylariaceae sp. AK1471]